MLGINKSNWNADIARSYGEFLRTKPVSISNGMLVLNKAGMISDYYYLEIMNDGQIYRTGLSLNLPVVRSVFKENK